MSGTGKPGATAATLATSATDRVPYGTAGVVLGLAAWEIGVRIGEVPRYILPPLSEVLQSAVCH